MTVGGLAVLDGINTRSPNRVRILGAEGDVVDTRLVAPLIAERQGLRKLGGVERPALRFREVRKHFRRGLLDPENYDAHGCDFITTHEHVLREV